MSFNLLNFLALILSQFFFSTQFNGHNVTKEPAKDNKAYARALLDILFTKEEQSQGLVVSTNSGRLPLDEEKTHLLFGKSAD